MLSALCSLLLGIAAAEADPPSAVPELDVRVTWIGNTLGGGDERNRGLAKGDLGDAVFMQNRHEDMWVSADGTVVMNTHWDEGHHEVGIYRDGTMVGYARDTGGGKGGWDVTGDERYIYAGLAVDHTFKQRGIARYHWDGTMAPWKGAASVNRLPIGAKTDGLAVLDGVLYASAPGEGQLVLIDADSMGILRKVAWEKPGKLVADPRSKSLWMIEGRGPEDAFSRIVRLDAQGNPLAQRITDVVRARDLAIDPITGHLAITDDGPDQQVHFYDFSGAHPVRVRSFGAVGGVMRSETPGKVADDRLHGPWGLGFDREGNLYVACRGSGHDGTLLRSWNRQGEVRWTLAGLMFVDCASIDPGDENSIYTKGERFSMDWSRELGEEWTHAAWLHDHHRFDDFPRGCTALLRRIDGERILYTLDMTGTYVGIYRFEGELAVPCGVMTSRKPFRDGPTGRCVWLDRNGNARVEEDEWLVFSTKRDCILGIPDADGNMWISGWGAKVRVMPCAGLDERGVPVYRVDDEVSFAAPSGMTGVDRVHYDPGSDVLYASGSTEAHPRKFSEDEQFITGGSVLVRVDGWWKSGNRNPTWTQAVRRYDRNHDLKSFTAVDDLLFTVERQTSRIGVYDARTGAWLRDMDPPPHVGPVAGHIWVDIPYALTAHRRSNGEYVLIQEDDVYGKNILWRITARW